MADPKAILHGKAEAELDPDQLDTYIKMMHPRKDGKTFGICDNMNSFSIFRHCCSKFVPITKMSKEVGLGPSLFLMSANSLAWMFMLLAILNIPVYLFYYQASQWPVLKTKDYFSKLSLGNLGTEEYACDR